MVISWVYILVLLLICFHSITCASDAEDHSAGSSQRHLQSIGEVQSFRLINADTNLPIVTLTNGMIINIATLSTKNFNVQVTTTNGTIVAIRFGYNANSKFRTESLRPFALCGDGLPVGNYYVCKELIVGNHTISATPYSITGEAGVNAKISFTISNVTAQNDSDPSGGIEGEVNPTESPSSDSCNIEKVCELAFA